MITRKKAQFHKQDDADSKIPGTMNENYKNMDWFFTKNLSIC